MTSLVLPENGGHRCLVSPVLYPPHSGVTSEMPCGCPYVDRPVIGWISTDNEVFLPISVHVPGDFCATPSFAAYPYHPDWPLSRQKAFESLAGNEKAHHYNCPRLMRSREERIQARIDTHRRECPGISRAKLLEKFNGDERKLARELLPVLRREELRFERIRERIIRHRERDLENHGRVLPRNEFIRAHFKAPEREAAREVYEQLQERGELGPSSSGLLHITEAAR